MINTTLCYIECDEKYLMLYRNKKKNDLNEGKWIGIGGKIEPGETPEECMLREIYEETGIHLPSSKFHGIIHFRSDKEDEEMYLYSASLNDFPLLKECSEGELAWIPKSQIMSLSLWEGDRMFLKKLVDGEEHIEMLLRYQGDSLIECIDMSGPEK